MQTKNNFHEMNAERGVCNKLIEGRCFVNSLWRGDFDNNKCKGPKKQNPVPLLALQFGMRDSVGKVGVFYLTEVFPVVLFFLFLLFVFCL